MAARAHDSRRDEIASVFVIAEAGSNWRMGSPARDLAMAHALIDVAQSAGADAVKFQTFRASEMYPSGAGSIEYLEAQGIDISVNTLISDLEMPYEMLGQLARHCADAGIEFMSTPFSPADAAAVDPWVQRHKIASYELNHVPLIEAVAGFGKPILMSTGAATEEEVAFGIGSARRAGASDVTLLQCTSAYPAPLDSLNLAAIRSLRDRFGVPTGLSDHSRDPVVAPVAAVALGATCIEKHFTLDNRLPGPDHRHAVEPEELSAMVRAIRSAEDAIGTSIKAPTDADMELRRFAVRAIQATRDIGTGELLVEGENIAVLRPGKRVRGIDARHLRQLRERRAAKPIEAGDGVRPEDVDPPL